MKKEFSQKGVIVTGAAKGIGAAIAKYFVEQGAFTALVDVDKKALDQTVAELNKISDTGGKPKAYHGDVLQKSFLQDIVNDILSQKYHIDVLVNNAGIIRDNYLGKITEPDWDAVLAVNLKGPFLFCQVVSEPMRQQQHGKIVNIISRSWLGNVGQSNYSASKGGLVSLTRTLALELAKFNINVNGVAPGLIDTPMTRGLPEKVLDKLIQMQPTKKIGHVEDIAHAVGFLASDRADFISGQILHVDGGKSCGLLSL